MIGKFFNGGKSLLVGASIVILATSAFAGFGSVTSNADKFPGLRTLFPVIDKVEQKGPVLSIDSSSNQMESEGVRINGEGFEPYEVVRFAAGSESKDGSLATIDGVWAESADGKGRLSTVFNVPDPSKTYTVTATGTTSGLSGKIVISTENELAKLDQCANGPIGAEVPCDIDSEWVNGNLNDNKAHWVEGQTVPYRIILSGMTATSTGNTLTIEWDTTKQGKHATDYIETFNATESAADPCAGQGCNLAAPDSTIAIPVDPMAVNQQAGVITAWGATITGISSYTLSGDYAGDSSTRITITFTADSADVVFAWGGHIATRVDWGAGSSATAIPGSPYHMRLIELNGSGGNQDRALAAAAVTLPANITIIKVANPESSFAFGFTTDLPGLPASFDLIDDGTATDRTTTQVLATDGFGTYNVTESDPAPFTFTDVTCSVVTETSFPAGSTSADSGSTNPSVSLDVLEGNDYTCTFTNDFLTAAEANIVGKVSRIDGTPIVGAWVSATDINGNTVTARTNVFGYYQIRGIEAGTSLFFDVASKGYDFGTRFLTVNGDMTVDFTGTSR